MGSALTIALQSSIIASGCATYTVGETFPIMQTAQKEKIVSLSVPKYEIPSDKPIVKKKSWLEKLILIIKNWIK